MANTVKNTIADSRQCIAESSNGRKKTKKRSVNIGSPLSPLAASTRIKTPEKVNKTVERKEFNLTALTADDAEDLRGAS